MSDIDFLANKKSTAEPGPKSQGHKKEKIVWSEPDASRPIVRETPFFWLSFLNKKKPAKKPALAPRPAVDKNKIKESRRKILKFIKRNEDSGPAEKNKAVKNFFTRLIEKFKKQPSHKILIDYQRVFNQEKIKRGQSAGAASSVFKQGERAVNLANRRTERSATHVDSNLSAVLVKRDAPAKLVRHAEIPATPAMRGEPPVTVKRVKKAKPGWITKFWGMFKAEKAVLIKPKTKPVRISLAEIFKSIRQKIVKPRPAKPAGQAKAAPATAAALKTEPVPRAAADWREIKIKARPQEKAEAPQIKSREPRVLETNLIKGEIITFFDWRKKIIILVNAILIPTFFVAAIYFGLIYYQGQSQARIQEQIKKYDELTDTIKQEEVGLRGISEFQNRLKIVSQIFAKHIYWTNFFKFLEDNTIADVYYAGFAGDTGGNYLLEAVASKFSDIAQQVNIFKNNKKITNISTTGGEAALNIDANKTRVKFNLSFSILKSIFTE